MPGSQQCETLLCREFSELEHLADSSGRGFFQQYVQSPLQRIVRDLVTRLRWSTERHRFKIRKRLKHRADVSESRQPFEGAVGARDRAQLERTAGGQGGHMLIACDLAEPNDCDLYRIHSYSDHHQVA